MQSVSSRIWTRVAVSISYDDNHYTTGTPQSLMLATPLSPFFLDTIFFISSLGCKTFSIITYFLVLCFIYLSSSFVHFKNGPKYITRRAVLVFIPLLRNLVSRSFLVLLKYYFFPSSPFVCYQYFLVLIILLYSSVQMLSGFDKSILSAVSLFFVLIFGTAYFSVPNFIAISWLYILIGCVRVSRSLIFLANAFILYKGSNLFSCDFANL